MSDADKELAAEYWRTAIIDMRPASIRLRAAIRSRN